MEGHVEDQPVENGGEVLFTQAEAILARWQRLRLSSRRIVREVWQLSKQRDRLKTRRASVEAYACLLALEWRIQKRYGSIIAVLLHYFAWKRETNALQRCCFVLGVSNKTALHEAIVVALQQEGALAKQEEESDKDGSGGKRNAKESGAEEVSGGEEPPAEGEKQPAEQEQKREEQERKEGEELQEGEPKPAQEKEGAAQEVSGAENRQQPRAQQPEQGMQAQERDGGTGPRSPEKLENNTVQATEQEINQTRERIKVDEDAFLAPPVPMREQRESKAREQAYFPRYSHALGTDLDVIATEFSVLHTPEGEAKTAQILAQDAANMTGKSQRQGERGFDEALRDKEMLRGQTAAREATQNTAQARETGNAQQQTAQQQTSQRQAEPISVDLENQMRDEITRNMSEEQLSAFRDAMQEAADRHAQEQTEQFLQGREEAAQREHIVVNEATEQDRAEHARRIDGREVAAVHQAAIQEKV